MAELDLSSNNLSSHITRFLQGLILDDMNLSFNDFEGEVPMQVLSLFRGIVDFLVVIVVLIAFALLPHYALFIFFIRRKTRSKFLNHQ